MGGETPLPVRATDEGLPAALWTIDSVAVFAPADDGVNVTVTVCAAAPALTVNDVGLTVNIVVSAVPTRAMEKIIRAALPVFPTVKVFWEEDPTVVLSIVREVTEMLITGVGAVVPLPVKATEEGLPAALWAIDSEADLAPAEVGANVTVTVCAGPPALTVKVVGLTVNCEASVPETVMPVTLRTELPVLETVKVAVPEDPTFVLSIAREITDSLINAKPTPVPDRDTDVGLPAALWAMDSVAVFAPVEVGANVTVIV
ncbi:MAG: hypothetical protein A3F84_24065 [Candidatus Handelsmanbacteria bacterium RIFCSPLOWO2_12_FULL_64_10]|uniref:Uncharacterized protein n=1 Tax=Handelsmanbacteria sp. (strain RIFCSPLOWO2_12_FULL_64_10) TaxID=1817868 RepID=A0A1F6C331_HANXR|nr:MAG: hypothetical protein A3F84_24065 [Candidatus Handelsmanbacteria bacterium RIFCSPLOWO2_12_FULL_64_10]